MPFLDLLLNIGCVAVIAIIVFGVPAVMYFRNRNEDRSVGKARRPTSRPSPKRGRPITAGGSAAVTPLQEVTAMLQAGASSRSAFGNTVKISTDKGVIFIDGHQTPPSISNDDEPADCTLRMDLSDFVALISGRLDGMSAFMTGRLKVEGSISVAMKLRNVLR